MVTLILFGVLAIFLVFFLSWLGWRKDAKTEDLKKAAYAWAHDPRNTLNPLGDRNRNRNNPNSWNYNSGLNRRR